MEKISNHSPTWHDNDLEDSGSDVQSANSEDRNEPPPLYPDVPFAQFNQAPIRQGLELAFEQFQAVGRTGRGYVFWDTKWLAINRLIFVRRRVMQNKLPRLRFSDGLRQLLRLELSWAQFDTLFNKLDASRSGSLSLETFLSAFDPKAQGIG